MNSALFLNIFFALMGGFVMNFMPCILPLISLKISSFLGSYDNKCLYITKNVSYISGVLSFFFGLSCFLSVLKIAGKNIMFGSHMQSGLLLFVIFSILILIGYNLAGLFEITIFSSVSDTSSRFIDKFHGGQILVNYFNGLLSSVLAIPCTAPFIGTAFAYGMGASGFLTIFLVTIFMGIGFALPFIFAALTPKLALKIMPRPGAWMDKFKQLMAFPILATACWILFIMVKQGNLFYVALSLAFALVMYFAIWLYRHFTWKSIYKNAVILCALLMTYFLLPEFEKTKDRMHEKTKNASFEYGIKQEFSKNALNNALQNKENILIVASASWCMTCSINEKNALSSNEFMNALREKKIIYFYLDLTNENPEGQEFLNERMQIGIPYYVLINKNGKEVIWPQLLRNDIVMESLNNL